MKNELKYLFLGDLGFFDSHKTSLLYDLSSDLHWSHLRFPRFLYAFLRGGRRCRRRPGDLRFLLLFLFGRRGGTLCRGPFGFIYLHTNI